MIKKQMYEAPATEVLELKLEGVIASSPFGSGETRDAWDESE